MTKRETLEAMLEGWHDYVDPALGGGERAAGGEARVPLGLHDPHCRLLSERAGGRTCTCWARSFAELERCLRLLRAEKAWPHLNARYFLATRTRRSLVFRGHWQGLQANERVLVPDMSGKARTPTSREYDALVLRWPAWVSLAEVAVALGQLERLYRGEPQLPAEATGA